MKLKTIATALLATAIWGSTMTSANASRDYFPEPKTKDEVGCTTRPLVDQTSVGQTLGKVRQTLGTTGFTFQRRNENLTGWQRLYRDYYDCDTWGDVARYHFTYQRTIREDGTWGPWVLHFREDGADYSFGPRETSAAHVDPEAWVL